MPAKVKYLSPAIISLGFVAVFYAYNSSDATITIALRSMAFFTALGLVLGGLTLLPRIKNHSDVVLADMNMALVMMFIYGYLVAVFPIIPVGLWLTIPLLVIFMLHLKLKSHHYRKLVAGQTVIGIMLLIVAVGTAVINSWGNSASYKEPITYTLNPVTKPSIIYIVPDRYAGNEILKEQLGYDNSDFLSDLESRGFIVSEGMRANYDYTTASIASVLNMDYLDNLVELDENSRSPTPLYLLLQQPRAIKLLQDYGYGYVHIGSWFEGTGGSRLPTLNKPMSRLNEFEYAFLKSTMLGDLTPYIDGTISVGDMAENMLGWNKYGYAANLVYKGITELNNLEQYPQPFVCFAHIVCPHAPYVFDKDGNQPADGLSTEDAYIGQLQYFNKLLLDTVDELLLLDPQPVIIIQADEGLVHRLDCPKREVGGLVQWVTNGDQTKEERVSGRQSILSAVYYPFTKLIGGEFNPIDVWSSPVNMFPVIFNELLGANIPLNDDHYYYRPDRDRYFAWSELSS